MRDLVIKKILFTFIIALSTFKVYAESPWKLIEIKSQDDSYTAGWIYQTYAKGTLYSKPPSKGITALRFICSTKNDNNLPIMAIFWDETNNNRKNIFVEMSLDNKILPFQSNSWTEWGSITYLPITEIPVMISDLEKSKTIGFKWIDSDGLERRTIFSMAGFTFNEFTNKCHSVMQDVIAKI